MQFLLCPAALVLLLHFLYRPTHCGPKPSFLDGVFAYDKQIDNETVCWAVAVTREGSAGTTGGRNLVGELKRLFELLKESTG